MPPPLGLMRALGPKYPSVRFTWAVNLTSPPAGNSTSRLLVQTPNPWHEFAFHRGLSTQNWRLFQQESPGPYHAAPSPGAVPFKDGGDPPRSKVVDFSQPEGIYRSKQLSELTRALLVLQLSGFDSFVQNSSRLMTLGQKVLRTRLFEAIMRRTFFGQFAMEEHRSQIQVMKQRLEDCGIASMFAVTAEEDVGENVGIFDEERYGRNADKMLYCLELTDQMCRVRDWPRLTQLKFTSYMNANVLANISRLIGEQESDPRGVGSVGLDNFMRGLNGEAMQRIPQCTEEEMEHVQKALVRFDRIVQRAEDLNIHILADAEKTNINPCISLVTLAMMKKFNRSKARVWNTYQCYLKVTEANLRLHEILADEEGFCFGVKLVRGAYMDGEKHNARVHGYEDPVQPSYKATSATYEKMMEYLMRRCLDPPGLESRFIVASHSEETVLKAIALMKKLGIPSSFDKIVFGQVYGMSDHVSYALGQANYRVYKSIPIGPIEEVLAYLARRALENNTAFHRLEREKSLLKVEIKRRLLSRS